MCGRRTWSGHTMVGNYPPCQTAPADVSYTKAPDVPLPCQRLTSVRTAIFAPIPMLLKISIPATGRA
ncbi:hypothetical protein CENSYa_0149 [Cenarchaeum symbiosum A]|uniref:Uncharacterized protein n=1 Tax=Cenarchaeum symbiosum (strain A) TaxID=414004 RepID=A0RTX7_CENSY|nr:hypothetical protein CENSYa_0149 [Cenarchaeum symbiosum A]